jgi:hypothetical protein
LFCGLSRESAAGHFAGSQERVLLAVCLVFHRWSGHGDAEPDFLVFRRLSSESAADCFALSPQERITPVVLDCTLKREVGLWSCQVLDENRDENVLSDILRRGDSPKHAGAYVSSRSDQATRNDHTNQYQSLYQSISYSSEMLRSIELSKGLERLEPQTTGTNHVFYRYREPECDPAEARLPKYGNPEGEPAKVRLPKLREPESASATAWHATLHQSNLTLGEWIQ